jgi:hypothetical protein
MPQSSTLFIGIDVHQDSSAVASVVQEHGAEVAIEECSGRFWQSAPGLLDTFCLPCHPAVK